MTVALVFVVVAGTPGSPGAAPKARLWERWTTHDPRSEATIDHSRWQQFLAQFVVLGEDGINRVAYRQVDTDSRRALSAYLAELAAIAIGRYRREEQLAYWINLYNALTADVVLDHYPLASIRDIDISPGLFADGPWGKKLIEVEGEPVSLDDIEHRILRPIWRDPHLHYVLVCAAVGCPHLQPTAITGANADGLLDQSARDYVNHPRGARLVGGRLTVSRIYTWYREDFGDSDADVIAHLQRYADPERRRELARVKRISGHAYDWALNDAPRHAGQEGTR